MMVRNHSALARIQISVENDLKIEVENEQVSPK